MANDVSCCRIILMAYTIALTHQIHVIGTNTTDSSTIGNTADSTSISTGQQATNAALASTVTPSTSTDTVPPTPTYSSACTANCSRDFQHFYGNLSIDIHSCQSLAAEPCYQIVPINNCTQLQAQLKTNGSFGLLCSPSGLQVFRYSSSCSTNVLSLLNSSTSAFCGLKGWNCTLDANSNLIKIDENTLLKPLTCRSTNNLPATTTGIPLTPNPVGPAAITAIVVLVCLTIVAILAGFFFWPKCHNPQAPPLKKKAPPPVDPTPQVAYSVSRKQATVSLPPGNIGHNAV